MVPGAVEVLRSWLCPKKKVKEKQSCGERPQDCRENDRMIYRTHLPADAIEVFARIPNVVADLINPELFACQDFIGFIVSEGVP